MAAGLVAAASSCGRPSPVLVAPGGRAAAPTAAAARLERAIEAAGGVAALDRARALLWEGDAVVTAGGRAVRITGRWAVQPPDTAVVTTYDVTRGPATARSLVVAAPRGWIVFPDRTAPMPPALLASERDEFALYEAMRLLPLRGPGVRLTPVDADSAGHAGVRATRRGRPDVNLWFDAATGRLAHLAATVADAGGGAPVRQDVWLDGVVEAGGVRWPRRLRIAQGGAPFLDLTIRGLQVTRRVEDARLAGPGGGGGR